MPLLIAHDVGPAPPGLTGTRRRKDGATNVMNAAIRPSRSVAQILAPGSVEERELASGAFDDGEGVSRVIS